jgi:hypothetical protein
MLYQTLPKLYLQEEFGQTSKHETKRVLRFTAQTYVEVSKLFPTVPVISVECCKALDHVCGLRFMDKELIPVALFAEDVQGSGKAAQKGGRWAGIRRSIGMCRGCMGQGACHPLTLPLSWALLLPLAFVRVLHHLFCNCIVSSCKKVCQNFCSFLCVRSKDMGCRCWSQYLICIFQTLILL